MKAMWNIQWIYWTYFNKTNRRVRSTSEAPQIVITFQIYSMAWSIAKLKDKKGWMMKNRASKEWMIMLKPLRLRLEVIKWAKTETHKCVKVWGRGAYRVMMNISAVRGWVWNLTCVTVIFPADGPPASSGGWIVPQTLGTFLQSSCTSLALVHQRCSNPQNLVIYLLFSSKHVEYWEKPTTQNQCRPECYTKIIFCWKKWHL